MKTLQRLGKSLMLPVACLPVAGILMGIGYWIDPAGWGSSNLLALLLVQAGSILINNMALLFAVGVAVGMSVDQQGTAGLAGLVSWLTVANDAQPGSGCRPLPAQRRMLHLVKSITSSSAFCAA